MSIEGLSKMKIISSITTELTRLWKVIYSPFDSLMVRLEIKRLEEAARECREDGLTQTAEWYEEKAKTLIEKLK